MSERTIASREEMCQTFTDAIARMETEGYTPTPEDVAKFRKDYFEMLRGSEVWEDRLVGPFEYRKMCHEKLAQMAFERGSDLTQEEKAMAVRQWSSDYIDGMWPSFVGLVGLIVLGVVAVFVLRSL